LQYLHLFDINSNSVACISDMSIFVLKGDVKLTN